MDISNSGLNPNPGPGVQPDPAATPGTPDPGKAGSTEGKEETEKKISGLVNALQEERGKRHSSEGKVADLEGQLFYLQGKIEELDKKTDTGKADVVSDDDFVTGKQIKTLLDAKGKEVADLNKQEVVALKDTIRVISETAAQERYSVAKVGKELSFDEVVLKATDFLKKNPHYYETVRKAADPAETVYQIGLMHPDIQAAKLSSAAQQVVDTINSPKPKVTTGSGGGGGTPKLSDLPMDQLVNTPLDKLVAEAKKE